MVGAKKWRLLLYLCLAALTGGGWHFFFGGDMNCAAPQYIMQVITQDPSVSRTITWQTERSDLPQMIVYSAGQGGRQHSLTVQPEALLTGAEAMSVYSVTLENLKPGTVYFYKVGCERNWSAWYPLRTKDKGQSGLKALIFGDSQSGDYAVWAKTAQRAWQDHPDADFFISMGDLVDIGSHYDQWKCWLNGASEVIRCIPAAPLSGNHENYLPGGTFTPAYLYRSLFKLPDNGPEGLKGQAYSYNYGDVHFAVIDSQEKELKGFQPDMIKRQAEWLDRDLGSADRKWKIVLAHRPFFINEPEGALDEWGRVFAPILDKHHVDIVFSAHIHTYGRSIPMRLQSINKEDKAGTVFISTGRSGDKTWEEARQKRFELVFDRCLDQPDYLLLESRDGRLTVTNVKQDGRIADIAAIKKEGIGN